MNDLELLYAAYLEKKERQATLISFPEQEAFINDRSQFIAALCTRRAGKTTGFALRFKETLDRFPGSTCYYFALTRDSAKNIMWPILDELNETLGWRASFTEHDLTMALPNKSELKLYGADMKNFIRRLRGISTPGAAIDEAQEFGSQIASLIDDILTPATADYGTDGWIALGGTPGPIPLGYFFNVTEERKYGYSLHKWSLYDNPHMPDPRGFVERLKKKKEWADDNPTLLREYHGLWVLDKEALLIKYDATKNHYENTPAVRFNYILGIDIGLRDSDALCVLGWSDSSQEIYLVEEIITADQDISSLAAQIETLLRRYDISKIVMDTGGLGAKIAEEFTRRKQIPITAADKRRKFENVTFLNDWLRLGKFKAKKDSRFAEDSLRVQIDYEKTTPDRLVVKDSYHSDIIDAVLYAFKESPAFTYQSPKARPKYGTREWAELEAFEMEQKALEHFTRQAEAIGDDDESKLI